MDMNRRDACAAIATFASLRSCFTQAQVVRSGTEGSSDDAAADQLATSKAYRFDDMKVSHSAKGG